jgi:hypothetical protein
MLLSKKGLEKVYGTDEPEYSVDKIKRGYSVEHLKKIGKDLLWLI